MIEGVVQMPLTVAFAELWFATQTACGRHLPAKDDFPLRDLAPFMSSLALIAFEPDGRGKYVLFGTQIAANYGVDLTGTYVEDLMDPAARAERKEEIDLFFETHGNEALRGRWSVGQARSSNGRLIEYEDLSLPYLEPNTEDVRQMTLLGMIDTLEFGEGVTERYGTSAVRNFDCREGHPLWLVQDPASRALNDKDSA